MNLLIITRKSFLEVTDDGFARIKAMVPRLTVVCKEKEALEKEDVLESEIIFGAPPLKWLAEAGNLKWIHIPYAGVEAFCGEGTFAGPDVRVTNASGVYSTPIAEQVVGIFLSLARQIPTYLRDQAGHVWNRREDGYVELSGSTVCIIGFGSLGEAIAQRLKGFGCTVLGIRRDAAKRTDADCGIYPMNRLAEALSRSDFVVSCLPHTKQTAGILDSRAFKAMKPSAFFVNVGRGSAVVTDDLISALKERRLAGAGLDVFETEPLPADSLLWDMENVIITPHSAGFSNESIGRNFELFADLLRRYENGEQLYNIVDLSAGY